MQVESIQLDDGGTTLGVELPAAPCGDILFLVEDESAESKALLNTLVDSWAALWPQMLEHLRDDIALTDVELDLDSASFTGQLWAAQPDAFMGDESDFIVGLDWGTSPEYHFFIRGTTIAHFQAVF